MNRFFSILIMGLLLTACNAGSSKHSKNTSSDKPEVQSQPDKQILVDKIHIGMTVQEMKDLYTGADFVAEPVYMYGLDGDNDGIVVKENNVPQFFVWTMEGEDKIAGIAILSDKIIIDKNVHVGMTLEDFLKKYPNEILSVNESGDSYEYIYIPDPDYSVEFLTTDSTRVAEYDYTKDEPEFLSIKRPTATIDRISL
jgi:hypothetical protein